MANLSQIAYMNWDFVAGEWGTPYEKHLINWELMTSADDYTVPQVTARLSVYPTPFAGSVNIVLQSKSNAPVQVSVYNLKGQLIKTMSGSKSLTWDGTDRNNQPVSNGIYFIKAEQDGRAVTGKVIRIK
jgi:hypothetical protein